MAGSISLLRVFICGPIDNGGRMKPKTVEANRWVAVETERDLRRAGFAVYCDPLIYDERLKRDPEYKASAFDEARAWIQTSDIFLRLPGDCIQAAQREYFAESRDVIIVRSVPELLRHIENG